MHILKMQIDNIECLPVITSDTIKEGGDSDIWTFVTNVEYFLIVLVPNYEELRLNRIE